MKAGFVAAAAALVVVLVWSAAGWSASSRVLHRRQVRQVATVHRDRGTVRFFRRRPWLARTRQGRRALRFARAELRWTRRELAETRQGLRALERPTTARWSAVASWYGPGFYGHGLACGGILTTSLQGVASTTLPCGERLLVCYRSRCAAVRVVDRGPFVAGRSFDLTGGLAVWLGFGGVGVITWQPL